MKVFKLTLAALALIMGFVACSSDDDETTVPEIFTGKRLVKLDYSTSSSWKEWDELTYSKGKLTRFTYVEEYEGEQEKENFQITYSGNTVVVTNQSRSGKEKEEVIYTLNAEGYATSAVYTYIEEYEDELDTETETYTFGYTDGYLTKIEVVNEEDKETTTISYDNGNVVSYHQMGNTYTCVASEKPNRGGILPPYGWLGDAAGAELQIAHYAGILGKHTKNLIAKEGPWEYTYSMDGEYVKSCTVNDNEVFNYTFD